MNKETVSVIIPSYNSVRTIRHVIKALEGQTRNDLLKEVLVIDSSDDNETKKVLSGLTGEPVKVIHPGKHVMPATARNIGAEQAGGDILAFLDADAYPAPDWIEKITEAYADGHPVGGGGIGIAGFQRNIPIAVAQYYLQFNEFLPAGKGRTKQILPACNIFCDRELFRRMNGFPEIRASEDVLFGLKMSKAAEMWFIPDAVVYHIFREDWPRFLRNQRLLGKYVSIYRKKYYRTLIYKGIIPLLLLPAFLCIKLLRITARIGKAGFCHMCRFTITLPVFFTGLLFWAFGFIAGCIAQSGGIKDATTS